MCIYMVQFCTPHTYSMTIHVWYVPYAYNDILRADSTAIRNRATAPARFEKELQLYCYSY